MKATKEQIMGFTSSAVLCLILALILSLLFFQTEMKTQEEGVRINFGTVDWAAGTFEPKPENNAGKMPAKENIPKVEAVKKPPLITQQTEQTAVVETANKEVRKQDEKSIEQERRLAEDQRRREAINRQMSGVFGKGNTPEGNEGIAESGKGNQGSPQGNAPAGSYTGMGGIGDFDLSGRSLRDGGLQRPDYVVQEEGTIVVEITVDPKGNVINAKVRLKGTNIENSNLRKAALEAARKTKFNAISGTQNQIGTITYIYTLKINNL
ncbi:MAG: TonB family protein [Dysgonamonadaceae bacterium]|jgi:TonB family protein|nr:TonB family protein [Dysgonamonadaceae bacterium]